MYHYYEVVMYTLFLTFCKSELECSTLLLSVQWGDSFSTVEGLQYIGGTTSVHVGDNISTVGGTLVPWRIFSTVKGYLQYCGG